MPTIAGPVALLLVSMLSIQFGAALAKTLFPAFGPEGTSLIRLWLAALILAVVWRPWRTKLGAREARAVVAYGAALGGMNFLFYLAIARVPIGLAVAVEFTGPLVVAVLGSRRARDFVWVALAACGVLLVLPIANASAHVDVVGIALAAGAGACWGLYIVTGKTLGQRLPGGTAASLGMMAAAVVVLPFGAAAGLSTLWNPPLWPAAFAMAVLSSAVPYTLEMFALKRLPQKTFGVLMSIEPAMGALSGFVVLGELLTGMQWLAIGCVIAASAGAAFTSSADEPAV